MDCLRLANATIRIWPADMICWPKASQLRSKSSAFSAFPRPSTADAQGRN